MNCFFLFSCVLFVILPIQSSELFISRLTGITGGIRNEVKKVATHIGIFKTTTTEKEVLYQSSTDHAIQKSTPLPYIKAVEKQPLPNKPISGLATQSADSTFPVTSQLDIAGQIDKKEEQNEENNEYTSANDVKTDPIQKQNTPQVNTPMSFPLEPSSLKHNTTSIKGDGSVVFPEDEHIPDAMEINKNFSDCKPGEICKKSASTALVECGSGKVNDGSNNCKETDL